MYLPRGQKIELLLLPFRVSALALLAHPGWESRNSSSDFFELEPTTSRLEVLRAIHCATGAVLKFPTPDLWDLRWELEK